MKREVEWDGIGYRGDINSLSPEISPGWKTVPVSDTVTVKRRL